MNSHKFETQIAIDYDVETALLLETISFWLTINCTNKKKKHYHDGRWWLYNTYNSWTKLLPYYTAKQMRRIIKNAKDNGLIIIGNYNKRAADQTPWYTLSDKALNYFPMLKEQLSTPPAQTGTPPAQTGSALPDPYTDPKTVSSLNSKTQENSNQKPANDNTDKDKSPANAGEAHQLTEEAKNIIAIWNILAVNVGCPKVGNNKRQLKAIQKNLRVVKQKWEVVLTPETFEIMLKEAINNKFYLLTKYYQTLDVFLRWHNFEAAYLDIQGENNARK